MAVNDGENARLLAELKAVNHRLVESELVNRRLRRQLKDSRGVERRVTEQLRTIRRSASWRITYPLRVFARLFAREKR